VRAFRRKHKNTQYKPLNSVFLKNILQSYRSFGKNEGQKHLPTPDHVRDFTGLFKKTRQGCRTFLKFSGKVIELFQKSSPELPVFFKKVRVAIWEFRKKTGLVWI
jgi:transposase InsO family protein